MVQGHNIANKHNPTSVLTCLCFEKSMPEVNHNQKLLYITINYRDA